MLVIERHVFFRRALKAFLETTPGVEKVTVTDNLKEALNLIPSFQPHLLLCGAELWLKRSETPKDILSAHTKLILYGDEDIKAFLKLKKAIFLQKEELFKEIKILLSLPRPPPLST